LSQVFRKKICVPECREPSIHAHGNDIYEIEFIDTGETLEFSA